MEIVEASLKSPIETHHGATRRDGALVADPMKANGHFYIHAMTLRGECDEPMLVVAMRHKGRGNQKPTGPVYEVLVPMSNVASMVPAKGNGSADKPAPKRRGRPKKNASQE